MQEGYVSLHDNIFPTLLAISSEEQARGLMHQTHPSVMSFIYASPRINKFWMHQTPSTLDIIFCCDGKVSQICKGEPYSTKIIGNDSWSDMVIELPYGTASDIDLKVGHAVELLRPDPQKLKQLIAHHSFPWF